MEKEKRNYHKESGYKAQKKYGQKNNYESQKKYAAKSDLSRINIIVHKPQYDRLKALADASNLSMSRFIVEIIKEKHPEVFND